MSIQKFYAAFQAPNVQCVTLASIDLNFETKFAFQRDFGDEDGCKYNAFLDDNQLEFIIFELEDSCPEIGIVLNGVAENYKILSFYYDEDEDKFLLHTIKKSESGSWEDHKFLIKVL